MYRSVRFGHSYGLYWTLPFSLDRQPWIGGRTRSSADEIQAIPIKAMTIIIYPYHFIPPFQIDPTFYTGRTGVQGVLDQLIEYLRKSRYNDRRSQAIMNGSS
jgi:hypothetical protein